MTVQSASRTTLRRTRAEVCFQPSDAARHQVVAHLARRRTLAARASSRDALLSLVRKYDRAEAVARTFEMAWTHGQLEFRYLDIGLASAQRFQQLASCLLFPSPSFRPSGALSQSRLGAYGISGDLPILTVTVADSQALPLIRELLLAHTYWRMRGLRVNLVILNQDTPGDTHPLRRPLERLITAHSLHTGTDRPGGVFLKDWYSMPDQDRTLILAASEVALSGTRGSLQEQLLPMESVPAVVLSQRTGRPEEPSQKLPFLELP